MHDDPRVLQSVLDPGGPQAATIARLWWIMFAVSAAVFAIVIAALAVALYRGRVRPNRAIRVAAGNEFDLTAAVGAAAGATTLVLFGLLVASIWTTRTIAAVGVARAVSVSIAGHQWWWEVEYEDETPSRRVKTANEIHIPVGRPVVFKVTSRDVIHSFWVPNLHGKRDLVPGISTAVWIQADRPGVFRGQCAEFCGMQHAHMAFNVVAESESDFERWIETQRRSSAEPATDAERRGREAFLAHQCALCHSVRGTNAFGSIGPDLTHVASRLTLAAGTLPNSRGHLAGWIAGSQAIKPGNRMPNTPMAADDLQDLLAYMEALK